MRTRNPEQRLRAFLSLCGSKRFDEETGAPQPAYKLDSMRLMAEFPKPKGVSLQAATSVLQRFPYMQKQWIVTAH